MSSKITLKPQSIRCHGNIVTSKKLDDFQSFRCNLEKDEKTGIYKIKNDTLGFDRLTLSADKTIVDELRKDKANLTVQLVDHQGNPVSLADVYVKLYIRHVVGEEDVFDSGYTDENGRITFSYTAQNANRVWCQAKSNTRISNTVFIDDWLYHHYEEITTKVVHYLLPSGQYLPNLDNWQVIMEISVSKNYGELIIGPAGTSDYLLNHGLQIHRLANKKIKAICWEGNKKLEKNFNMIWEDNEYYEVVILKRRDTISFSVRKDNKSQEVQTISFPEVSKWSTLDILVYPQLDTECIMKVKNLRIH